MENLDVYWVYPLFLWSFSSSQTVDITRGYPSTCALKDPQPKRPASAARASVSPESLSWCVRSARRITVAPPWPSSRRKPGQSQWLRPRLQQFNVAGGGLSMFVHVCHGLSFPFLNGKFPFVNGKCPFLNGKFPFVNGKTPFPKFVSQAPTATTEFASGVENGIASITCKKNIHAESSTS